MKLFKDKRSDGECLRVWISGYTVKEMADHFRRSPVTIGEGLMKVEDLLRKDRLFEKGLQRMKENLVKGRKRKYRVSVV